MKYKLDIEENQVDFEDWAFLLFHIGAVKECEFFYSPKCNDVLTTHVHILEEVFHLTLADITVKVGDTLVAQANVKIVLTDKEAGENKA